MMRRQLNEKWTIPEYFLARENLVIELHLAPKGTIRVTSDIELLA